MNKPVQETLDMAQKNDQNRIERELEEDVIGNVVEADRNTTDLTERLAADAARPSVLPSIEDANRIDRNNSLYDALVHVWIRENKAGRIAYGSHEYTPVVDNDEVYFIRVGGNAINAANYDSTSIPQNRR